MKLVKNSNLKLEEPEKKQRIFMQHYDRYKQDDFQEICDLIDGNMFIADLI
jgi:hypothetical protein